MVREERARAPITIRAISVLLVCAWSLSAGVAAAGPSETDRSVAQSLFEQGKRLMAAGKHAEACPKLEESQRLDPGGGTLLNLALCHELSGKIATAWAEFNEALSMARRDGRPERIKAAQKHISALEPKLPRLTLVVSSPAEGQELRVDGATVGSAAWGSPLSVDPGRHELRVSAPGRKEWSLTLTIALGEKRTLDVPQLELAEKRASVERTKAAPEGEQGVDQGKSDLTGRRTAGWLVGGVGVVSLAAGGYFGLQALAKRADSNEQCPTDDTCSTQGAAHNDDAYTNAWISNVGIGVGVVGVALGTYLVLSSGSAKTNAKPAPRAGWHLTATANAHGGKLQAWGRF